MEGSEKGTQSIADVSAGRFENQWVTFTGTVRRCVVQKAANQKTGSILKISVAASGQSLDVLVYGAPTPDTTRMIDSTVKVHGRAGSFRNKKGQFLASVVSTDRPEDVEILSPGPADPFDEPLQSIAKVLSGDDIAKRSDHRIRTKGVVTYFRPGHELYLQDDDDAVRVQTAFSGTAKIGDQVEVVGFEVSGGTSPHVEDGIIRMLPGHVPYPMAASRLLTQVVEQELDSRLVRVQGMVFDVVPRPGELLIVLQSGKNMIGAYLPDVNQTQIPGFQANAQVELTGVVSLIFDDNHKPKSFSLHLRDAMDARLLHAAPWWTTQRVFTLLLSSVLVILLVAFWVILLRKRVSAQTKLIRATLDGTADAILVLSEKHGYVDANEKFRTMWGLRLIECDATQPVPILDRIFSRLQDPNMLKSLLCEPTTEPHRSTVFNLLDGTIIECDFEGIQGSSTSGVVLSFRDITSRRLAERMELDRNQILEAISRQDDLDTILPKICKLAEQQDSAIHCTIELAGNEENFFSEGHLTGRRTDRIVASHPLLSSTNVELGNLLVTSSTGASVNERLSNAIIATSKLAGIAIENRQLFDQLDRLAYHDPLTGLLNRGALDAELQRAIQTSRSDGSTFALLCIDLDRFKHINDTLSHRTGDLFLCAVAERLTEAVQASGAKVFRVGGDEFTILLPHGSILQDAEEVAGIALETLRRSFQVGDRLLHSTASIGVSLFPAHGETSSSLLQAADSAMYQAKRSGKDQHKVFLAEWRVQEDGSFEMEALLRQAIEFSWFEIHYQPKLTRQRQVCGLEALIRLRHPKLGMISPDQFIAIAEEAGLIIQIGAWALDEVCRQITAWQEIGTWSGRVAVNVSAAQFTRGDFLKTVTTTLDRWGLPGEVLELELTESLLMKNISEATELMTQLRRVGVVFAIDDFGTGYSSLGYLHALPVSTLKIDRTFVAALGSSESSKSLVKSIVHLAKALSLEIVAEGVETEEQFSWLQTMECDQYQGYLFCRPQPADQIDKFLVAHSMGSEDDLIRPFTQLRLLSTSPAEFQTPELKSTVVIH